MLPSGLGPPEILEAGRGQLGVTHGALDVLVPEVSLKGAGVRVNRAPT